MTLYDAVMKQQTLCTLSRLNARVFCFCACWRVWRLGCFGV